MGKSKKLVNDHVVFWGTCSIYIMFVAALISSYTSIKVFPARYVNKFILSLVYQARWNVFVKRTTEPVYQSYTIQNGKLVLNDLRPFTPKYYFGLQRRYKNMAIETDIITTDSVANLNRTMYHISMPVNGNLGDYLSPDTLKFNDVKHENVVIMTGKYVLTVEPRMDWAEACRYSRKFKDITVIPVNISH